MFIDFVVLGYKSNQELSQVVWICHVRNIGLHHDLGLYIAFPGNVLDEKLGWKLFLGKADHLLLRELLNLLFQLFVLGVVGCCSFLIQPVNHRFKLLLASLVALARPKSYFNLIKLDSFYRLFFTSLLGLFDFQLFRRLNEFEEFFLALLSVFSCLKINVTQVSGVEEHLSLLQKAHRWSYRSADRAILPRTRGHPRKREVSVISQPGIAALEVKAD